MIPARKSALADAILGRLIVRGLRGTFHAFLADGLEHLATLDPTRPIVGCCNHTNWWDGFALLTFTHRRLGDREFHLAMEEKNLRRYFFFTWLGVFGLNLETKTGAIAGLRYGARLLQERAARIAWIFGQGTLTSPHLPIGVKGGAGFLARHSKAQILPVVLRYEWLQESRPTAFLRVGAPLAAETTPEELSAAMNRLLAALGETIDRAGTAGFTTVLPSRWSLNKRWDYLVHRLRGRPAAAFDAENR